MRNIQDLLILGAGPAGLTASIYASRYNIDHLVIGSEVGGYLNEIHKVENYPGFEKISGLELGQKMIGHAESFNGKVRRETVLEIRQKDGIFQLKTDKEEYKARNIVYSIGTSCKKLRIPGEKELLGKGVSYCATCDGPFFKGKSVAVVGGANSAAMAALMLSEYAKKVFVIYRRGVLRSAPSYIDKIEKTKNIEVLYHTTLKKILGKDRVEKVLLCNPPKQDKQMDMDGVFIEIGSQPNCDNIVELGVEMNEKGYIVTKPDQSTSLAGFFAAGDITTNSNNFRQIITAAAEGAVAALSVFDRLKDTNNE
ncbi:MAG: FAD-dependent oxidoreductase [Patescibacteria group bacterium]|nr:FAD-dependent oxidoreductase [Patescibacteria group bacterium]